MTQKIGRRELLAWAGRGLGSAMVLSLAGGLRPGAAMAAGEALGATLPPLPYAYEALEPFIDTQTMMLHHTRHHQALVTGLNNAFNSAPALRERSLGELLANLQDVPEGIRTAVRNNGGGHMNHSVFWATMAPNGAGGGGEPVGALGTAIANQFGSAAYLKSLINAAGASRFGSGWTWLAADPSGKLMVYSTPNQDSTYMLGHTSLIGIDVWEHAYYLRYQNRRADYLNAWWNVVNWSAANARYETAMR
jgi:superoxide dismutase, Fe-Mn family